MKLFILNVLIGPLLMLSFGLDFSVNAVMDQQEGQELEIGNPMSDGKTALPLAKAPPKDSLSGIVDTIKIEPLNYQQKIIFNKEMLFDHCRGSDVRCSVDATKFLAFLDLGVERVYSQSLITEGIFSEVELREQLKRIKNYIEQRLTLSSTIELKCPTASARERIRDMLKDPNHGIYYLFRWQYYSEQLKLGQVQFYYTDLDEYAQYIYQTALEKNNEWAIGYYLDIDHRRVFSVSKFLN